MRARCLDCRFGGLEKIPDGSLVRMCHCNPPQLMVTMRPNGIPNFAPMYIPVQDDMWCGKFEPSGPRLVS